ncbi:unnamed protein product [Macrosiphum euphorbiae]|uniref:Uncharacterized protein n=1 Tax=Macrosiphum euphorbiae TaxID=13131 RepID=A0AAV0XNL1_9HEMI|nr:unnamed protein product [Macrosiphum euphorbiae]
MSTKGAVFGVENRTRTIDEINQYQLGRYISSNEAIWRILSFEKVSTSHTGQGSGGALRFIYDRCVRPFIHSSSKQFGMLLLALTVNQCTWADILRRIENGGRAGLCHVSCSLPRVTSS